MKSVLTGFAVAVIALALLWLLAVCVHTSVVRSHQAVRKRAMGIPLNVMMPSDEQEALLAGALARLEAWCRDAVEEGHMVWADAGTALGLERHGDRIPWDDDYDFGCRQEDIAALGVVAARHGMRLQHMDDLYKLYDDATGEDLADLFPYARDGDAYQLALPSSNWDRTSPRYRISLAELGAVGDLRFRPFGESALPVLRDNLGYVKRRYGEDTMHTAIALKPHKVSTLQQMLYHVNPMLTRRFRVQPREPDF